MKKTLVFLIFLFVIVLILSSKTTARAALSAIEDYCKETTIKTKDQLNLNDWYYTAEKDIVSTNYILDYFQDPKNNGVSIDVTISAMDLIATYWKWETVDVCLPYNNYQGGMIPCKGDKKSYPGYSYFYLAPQRQCVKQPPEVTYRSIETGTISIWLEPTIGTRDLLGPGPYIINSNKPVLRYLYPDQWAPEEIHSGKLTIIEKPWFRNSDDIEEFLRKNKDFLILDTSFKDYDLTSHLPAIQSPTSKSKALSIYSFGNCDASLEYSGLLNGRNVCTDPTTEYTTGYGTKSFSITFDRIPLDEPGEWYIGVSFYQWPAKYDLGRSTEPSKEYRTFVFSDEKAEQQFSFESYIIRSAPCNPDEFDNCWEEKKKDTLGG